MVIERDRTAERLARIDALLTEARNTKATMARTDRVLARELSAKLGEMLKELRGPERPSNLRA